MIVPLGDKTSITFFATFPFYFNPSAKLRCGGYEGFVLVFHLKVVQQRLVMVLCGEAGVAEIAVGLPPVLNAAIVEQPQVFCDDERRNTALQTLPEEQ